MLPPDWELVTAPSEEVQVSLVLFMSELWVVTKRMRLQIQVAKMSFLWRLSRPVQLVGDPRVDPEHAGEIIYLIWPGNTSGSPRRSWKTLLGSLLPPRPSPGKAAENGWMDEWNLFFLGYQQSHKLHTPKTLEKWNFISPHHDSEDCLRFTF